MNDAFNVSAHAEAAQLIDSLVASGGGIVSYELGAPGREIAVAAGIQLAAVSGTPLTVIDFRHLLPQVRATITELDPHLLCTLLPVGEAVEHPERFTGGILVIHTDLLRTPGTRDALLARAGTADSLIVAARVDADDSVLNTFPGPRSARFVLSAREPMQRPGRLDGLDAIDMRFEAISGNANADPFAGAKDRFIRQLKQGAPAANNPVDPEEFTEMVSFEELLEAVRTADPDEIRRDSQRAEEQWLQRAADSPVPGIAAPYSSRQEQSEAALRPDAIDSGLLERHGQTTCMSSESTPVPGKATSPPPGSGSSTSSARQPRATDPGSPNCFATWTPTY
ncbi:hypothetical protein ACIQGT_26200 [Streptomyces sp. NPDC093108]|uniref:hypothetical protein n=1 Tax=Streptomyces sp. NPDC093108 TaxID=3366030 RepID=UPI00382B43EA